MIRWKKAVPFLAILTICALLVLANWWFDRGGAGYVIETVYRDGCEYYVLQACRELPEGWQETEQVRHTVPAGTRPPKQEGATNNHPVGAPIYTNPQVPDEVCVDNGETKLYIRYAAESVWEERRNG